MSKKASSSKSPAETPRPRGAAASTKPSVAPRRRATVASPDTPPRDAADLEAASSQPVTESSPGATPVELKKTRRAPAKAVKAGTDASPRRAAAPSAAKSAANSGRATGGGKGAAGSGRARSPATVQPPIPAEVEPVHVEAVTAAPAASDPESAEVVAPAAPVDTTDAATAVAPGDNEVMATARPAAGEPSLSILMVASEALPFAKTGGLADVAGALPRALAALGHRVTLVMPRYRGIDVDGPPVARLSVPMGGTALDTSFYEVRLGDRARAVLVDRPDLFDREYLYGAGNDDYADNPFRFGFLSRAALEFAVHTGMRPDVVHAHDWQAGLVPAYLATTLDGHPAFARAARIFTVHNLAYQGLYTSDWLPRLGLPWSAFAIDGLEYWLHASLLKSGIAFSHAITTVSPGYARQTLTPEFGFGFEGILANRGDDYVGILNGIDAEQWDPAHDAHLPVPYDAARLGDKRASKHALLTRYGMPADDAALARPLIGMIARMVDQKGLDLIAANAAALPDLGAAFVILGEGESRYQDMWRALARHAPDRIGVHVGFDEARAHLIEAGADIFMMPSRFEPCGLNQMYSQRYGTVPVVHVTGGLADTVERWDPATRTGTGFTFDEYRPGALLVALREALEVFADRDAWRSLQREGMARDFSWERSARAYVELYRATRARAGVAES